MTVGDASRAVLGVEEERERSGAVGVEGASSAGVGTPARAENVAVGDADVQDAVAIVRISTTILVALANVFSRIGTQERTPFGMPH